MMKKLRKLDLEHVVVILLLLPFALVLAQEVHRVRLGSPNTDPEKASDTNLRPGLLLLSDPAGNGRLVVPLRALNRSSSITPFSALASFFQADRSGKNAWVMQNVLPS